MRDRILQKMAKAVRRPIHFQRPISKPYSDMYKMALAFVTPSNWVWATASFPYLIGEIHWTQPSHAGIESVFAMNPPNRIIGIVKRGAMAVAEFTLGVMAEIKRPMPIEVLAVITKIMYMVKK